MNKFNEELDELKKANQEIKLDDEFKSTLKMKLDEEISKQEEKLNKKPKLNLLPRKLIPVTVCLFVLFVTMQTFADEIESLVKCVFSNVDETVEEAIANGNYQKIDMEYVEHDGISIKVDYIIQENNNTYIAFNVKSSEEIDKVYLKDVKIIDKENQKLEIIDDLCEWGVIKTRNKSISNNNIIIIYQIINSTYNMETMNKITINKIYVKEKNTIENKWELFLNEEATV